MLQIVHSSGAGVVSHCLQILPLSDYLEVNILVRFYQKLHLASLFLQLLEISHCCVDRECMLLTSGVVQMLLTC